VLKPVDPLGQTTLPRNRINRTFYTRSFRHDVIDLQRLGLRTRRHGWNRCHQITPSRHDLEWNI